MRVILIENHALFRDDITLILKQLADDVEVLCGKSAKDAKALAQQVGRCDLVLLDYNLTDSNGLDCLAQIRIELPNTPSIMLSAEKDTHFIQQVLHSGARGFITKSSSSQVIISAIHLVLSGGIYIPQEMISASSNAASPIPKLSTASDTKKPLAEIKTLNYHLTARQLDVLKQMLKGYSNKEIAKILSMSPSTVKVHVAAILKELNVKNRTQAVNIARTQHIIPL